MQNRVYWERHPEIADTIYHRISYHHLLFAGAEAGGVDVGGLWLEAVEAPDEGQLEIARHVADFHPVVLAGVADGHGRRPSVEYVIGFQIQLAAAFLSELPLDSGINLPYSG